jgi:hypothetical protein
MQMRQREAGQGGGWGCGLEQLAATVPCALLTVDDSKWRSIQQSIPFSSMSWFMYFRESKPKFLSPNSISTMAEITPNYSLVVGLLGTSKNQRFMRHNIKAERLSKLQSAVWRWHGRSSLADWWAALSGRASQRKGR